MKHNINQRKTRQSELEIQKEIAMHEYNDHLQSSVHGDECMPKSIQKAFASIKSQATTKANRIK
jgi:hypothetical protein